MGRVDLSERLLARALVMPERAVGRGGAVVHRVRRSRGARNAALCLAVAWLALQIVFSQPCRSHEVLAARQIRLHAVCDGTGCCRPVRTHISVESRRALQAATCCVFSTQSSNRVCPRWPSFLDSNFSTQSRGNLSREKTASEDKHI